MPSEKILAEKKQIVADLAESFRKAASGVIVDYSGITVAEDTKLRAELRKAGVSYSVKKNTLIRLAADQAGLSGLDDVLKGTTAVAVSESDLIAPAKVLVKFAKDNEKFTIKGGFIEGKVVSEKEISELSELPPKEVLIAKALGGFNAPITGFVHVLNANLTGLVRVLSAAAEKQSA